MEKGHENILTKKWWQHKRYEFFGNQVVEKFQANPNLQAEMTEVFAM